MRLNGKLCTQHGQPPLTSHPLLWWVPLGFYCIGPPFSQRSGGARDGYFIEVGCQCASFQYTLNSVGCSKHLAPDFGEKSHHPYNHVNYLNAACELSVSDGSASAYPPQQTNKIHTNSCLDRAVHKRRVSHNIRWSFNVCRFQLFVGRVCYTQGEKTTVNVIRC